MNDNFLAERWPHRTDEPSTQSAQRSSPFAAAAERYWLGLRKNAVAAAAIVATCLIAALIMTLLATPQYTAKTMVEISRDEANVTNVEGLESGDRNKDLEFYQTQYSLLGARNIAERVARRFRVVADDRLFNAFDIDPETALAGSDASSRARDRLDLGVDLLMANKAVDPLRGSSLVNVGFTSPSPELSAEIANLWVEQFQEAAIERRFSSTDDARDFLEGRLSELRQRLEDSQRQLVAYAAKKEIIPLADSRDGDGNTNTGETLRLSNLRTINEALSDATRERIAAESRVAQTAGASEASLSNLALNGMREKRAEVSAELANKLAIFEPEYPEVQALKSQLAAIDQSIADEEGRFRSAVRNSYDEALSRESRLRSQVNSLKADTLNERRDSIQFAIFQREVDTNRELYEGLLQRYKEIGVAGVGASNIAVVDMARVPEIPSSPNIPLNLALGLIAGFALTAGFIFVKEELDQSVRDPSQVTEALGLPLLGAIPHLQVDDLLEELRDAKSQISEAYFSTASNISFLTPTGAPKSFVITSTRPNEGKSTSAYALALAFSRIGKRCILVDSDLRNPSQHSYFGMKNEQGLTNLLTANSGHDIRTFCTSTDYERLDFMPAGPTPPEPGALLSSDALKNLVLKLGELYDIVIVDGPPLLGLADGPLLSRSVEGVVYNIEANGMKLRAIETALRRLRMTNAEVFGAIVTKLNSHNAAYGYGEGYGYGYKYVSDEQ